MKTISTKVLLVAIPLLVVVGCVADYYDQSCSTPEVQTIREAVQAGNLHDPAIQAKLAGMLSYEEKEDARICALQKLSADKVAAIVAQKQTMAGPTITPGADEVPPPHMLGIQEAIDQDIVGKEMVLGTNSWWGYVETTLTTVTGTAYRSDPSQGVLFVWEPDHGIGSSRIYPAPTATGPLKIISEANGILTVQSIAGTYEVYDINTDTRTYVKTTGGTTYTFDLRTRTLR